VNSPGIQTVAVRHWVRTAGRNRHGRRTNTISRWRDGNQVKARCSDAKGRDRKLVLHCGTNLRIQHPFLCLDLIFYKNQKFCWKFKFFTLMSLILRGFLRKARTSFVNWNVVLKKDR
jgi:hypothetical protein